MHGCSPSHKGGLVCMQILEDGRVPCSVLRLCLPSLTIDPRFFFRHDCFGTTETRVRSSSVSADGQPGSRFLCGDLEELQTNAIVASEEFERLSPAFAHQHLEGAQRNTVTFFCGCHRNLEFTTLPTNTLCLFAIGQKSIDHSFRGTRIAVPVPGPLQFFC
jgi:hypothetical protein